MKKFYERKLKSFWDIVGNISSKMKKTNAVSVFLTNVLSKILGFMGSMIIVRVLTKSEYGSYTYIMNCYSILILLYDLGCSTATMQYCNQNYSHPKYFNGYFTYGYKMAMRFAIITAVLILFSPYFYPFQEEETAKLTASLFLMPFLNITNEFLTANLRIKLENKKYAITNTISIFVHYIIILPMSFYFGIYGAVWSNYIISTVVCVITIWMSRHLLRYDWRAKDLNTQEKRSFLKYSLASRLNYGIDHALLLLDVFLIGIIIADNEVLSSYKISTTIPTALVFIPYGIVFCALPYLSRHCGDVAWIKRQSRLLIGSSALLNLVICVGGILTAPWVIPLLFGSQYSDAVLSYQILLVGYFFSATFRIPVSYVLNSQQRVRDNIKITILSGIANCILDTVLIYKIGAVGAAVATTAVHIINSALCMFFFFKYLRNPGTQRH